MMQNVLYYLTSSMAQVWAALMVFQILLVRETATRHHETIEQQWKIARKWWGPLLARLLNRDVSTKEKLAKYGLSDDLLSTAHTDRTSFIQVILAISRNQVVLAEGQSSGSLNGYDLSPSDWQRIFDPVAQKVEQASVEKGDPVKIFYIGCLGIALNVICLAISPLSEELGFLLRFLFLISCAGNLALTGYFVYQVRRALL